MRSQLALFLTFLLCTTAFAAPVADVVVDTNDESAKIDSPQELSDEVAQLQLQVNDLRSAVLTLTSFVADQFVDHSDDDGLEFALAGAAPVDKRTLTFTPGRGKRLAFTPGRGKRLAFTPGRGKRLAFTPGRGKRSLSYTPGRGKRAAGQLVFRGSRG